ncbi:MAG: PA4780 family RIO1-like protein kinase [Fibrobacterota bacterium]
MKIPKSLAPLMEEGLIDRVVQNLKSGKEADVFLVYSGGKLCCAKMYKSRASRGFRNQAVYQEGRKSGNSRRGRAMERNSQYAQQVKEEAWQSAEVDALFALQRAGVSVPQPHFFMDGALLMEAVLDEDGSIAPPLSQVTLTPQEGAVYHARLLRDAVAMLCVGIIHGDLSEYNILRGKDGPVIIDLPQWVNAAAHGRARDFFLRDIANLTRYFDSICPGIGRKKYGEEIWDLYSRGLLTPHSPLTGEWEESDTEIDTTETMDMIRDAEREEMERRERLQEAAEDSSSK